MWLTEKQKHAIVERLQQNKVVRRALPGDGHLFMDRQLPFICLYRGTGCPNETGMETLAAVGAGHLSAPYRGASREGASDLLRSLAGIMTERFGAFLILEIWAGEIPPPRADHPPRPQFKIYAPANDRLSGTVETLTERLRGIRTSKLAAEVTELHTRRTSPPDMRSCIPAAAMRAANIEWIGIEVTPIYLNPEDHDYYPMLFRTVRRQLSRALKHAFFAFSYECTTHHPPHYHTLGRRAVVKAVWEVDKQLADIGNAFDLLRLVTPVNAEASWNRFKRNKYQKPPRFLYLPRPVDPGRMKRRLFSVPIDQVEDPTLQKLFLDKQQELDRELSLMRDRNSSAFMYGSLQLHGRVQPRLLKQAQGLLDSTLLAKKESKQGECLQAEGFLNRVNEELAWYRACHADFRGGTQISPELFGGMLVSKGVLMVGKGASIPLPRVESLIQHEIGTHMLTWSNGLAQPLKLLAAGLPRYEEFQEGLAVLAEYLTGGLVPQRLRTLAARVVAVHAMTENADFVDVFHMLSANYEFERKSAYLIAMRVFRGGGYAKDAVYLRGLNRVLAFLADGGTFENCFIGKMGGEHMPVIEELLLRDILSPPAAMPRYLSSKSADEKLKKVICGVTVEDLLES